MKEITGYLLGAFALALLGVVLSNVGFIENDLARAEQAVASQQYGEAEASFATAERYLTYVSYVPGIGNGPLNAVRTRRAAARYWQREYAAIVPRQADPVSAVAADNVDLQFVVANAMFRAGQGQAKDVPTAVQALDAGINAYLTVIKNARRHDDAAYNVEYLARLRREVEGGLLKGMSNGNASPRGSQGVLSDEKPDTKKFKPYTPKNSDERDKSDEAGKLAPKARKG